MAQPACVPDPRERQQGVACCACGEGGDGDGDGGFTPNRESECEIVTRASAENPRGFGDGVALLCGPQEIIAAQQATAAVRTVPEVVACRSCRVSAFGRTKTKHPAPEIVKVYPNYEPVVRFALLVILLTHLRGEDGKELLPAISQKMQNTA